MSEQQGLTGTMLTTYFRNAESWWTICKVEVEDPTKPANPYTGKPYKSQVTVAGVMVEAPVPGLQYRFTGEYTDHPKYGRQFRSEFVSPVEPSTSAGVVSYLRTYAHGVGAKIAQAIVDKFGADACQTLRERPGHVAQEIKGLSAEKASKAALALREIAELSDAEIAVRGILEGVQVSRRQISRIMSLYRGEAPTVLRGNPYRLIRDISGIGWTTADAIAKRVGLAADAPERIKAARDHVLREAESGPGHTYVEAGELLARVADLCGVEVEGPIEGGAQIDVVEYVSRPNEVGGGDPLFVGLFESEMACVSSLREYLPATLRAEECIAARVAMLAKGGRA